MVLHWRDIGLMLHIFSFITYCNLTTGMKKSNIHTRVWKPRWVFAYDVLTKVWKWITLKLFFIYMIYSMLITLLGNNASKETFVALQIVCTTVHFTCIIFYTDRRIRLNYRAEEFSVVGFSGYLGWIILHTV